MTVESKLAPIRKGLLEFLVLKIVGAESMYVPDILRRLAGTEFATQEGTGFGRGNCFMVDHAPPHFSTAAHRFPRKTVPGWNPRV